MTNIKIVKLENGDDIVCSFPSEQLPEEHALLRITKPLQIKYIPQLFEAIINNWGNPEVICEGLTLCP